MTETLANGYSSESTQRELSYEYPHDLVLMIFIIICFFVHWTKITSAAKGLDTRTTPPLVSAHFVHLSTTVEWLIFLCVLFSRFFPNAIKW